MQTHRVLTIEAPERATFDRRSRAIFSGTRNAACSRGETLPQPPGNRELGTPRLREAWAAGDYSFFHGWDRRPGELLPAT
jgi:hypothetical protein